MATTPNMLLPVPDDHTDADTWGVALASVFGTSGGGIDAHDHSTGKGVLVPSAGIGINADLSFASFALTTAKAIAFNQTTTASVSGYASALFVNSSDHNLYFRNSSGSNVQITAGSTINVSLIGGIGGDYASVSALLSYVDANKDYLLQQQGSPRPWAGLETGDIKLFQKAASISNAVTLKSPNALASSYTVTMPAALPGSNALVQMDTSGVVTASSTLPNNTDITLQGTGKIKHGTKKMFVHVLSSTIIATGGSVSTNGSNPGSVWGANVVGYVPLPPLAEECTMQSASAYFAGTPGNSVSIEIVQTIMGGSGFTTTGITASGTTTPLTATGSDPMTGGPMWLKITAGAAGCTVTGLELTWTT